MGIAIVLIIIGIAIIIISCFMVDKTDKKNQDFVLNTVLEEKAMDISELKHQVEEICQEPTEGYLNKTENQLSQLSNEKIIAVNDFSEQILEKIKLNHEEVVFLYNMLGEKEEELKTLMRNADKQKKVMEETSARSLTAKESNAPKSKKNVSQVKVEQKQAFIPEESEGSSNSNQKILELYSQGFSIVDISKALELGQGEVRLVVDLYKENEKQQ